MVRSLAQLGPVGWAGSRDSCMCDLETPLSTCFLGSQGRQGYKAWIALKKFHVRHLKNEFFSLPLKQTPTWTECHLSPFTNDDWFFVWLQTKKRNTANKRVRKREKERGVFRVLYGCALHWCIVSCGFCNMFHKPICSSHNKL